MKAHYMPPRRWSTLKKSILILSVSIFTFFIYYMMDSTTPFAFAARRCKYFSLSELIYYTWFYFWPPTKITEALCWFSIPALSFWWWWRKPVKARLIPSMVLIAIYWWVMLYITICLPFGYQDSLRDYPDYEYIIPIWLRLLT